MATTRNESGNFVIGEPFLEDFTLTANGDLTGWVLLTGSVAIQVYGPSTSAQFVVQRSPIDPAISVAASATVDSAPLSGNPSMGMAPLLYLEPGAAWWRVQLSTKTGASINVSFSGVVAKK